MIFVFPGAFVFSFFLADAGCDVSTCGGSKFFFLLADTYQEKKDVGEGNHEYCPLFSLSLFKGLMPNTSVLTGIVFFQITALIELSRGENWL